MPANRSEAYFGVAQEYSGAILKLDGGAISTTL